MITNRFKTTISLAVAIVLFGGCQNQPTPSNNIVKKVEVKKNKEDTEKEKQHKVIYNINSDFKNKINSLYKDIGSLKPLFRDYSKEVVIDPNTSLIWQDNNEVKTIKKNWKDAKRHCQNLNLNGYSNWRLPTIEELLSITDDTKYKPAIKDSFKNVVSYYYWSSSADVSNSNWAWDVDFKGGDDGWGNKSNKYYVRCVQDR